MMDTYLKMNKIRLLRGDIMVYVVIKKHGEYGFITEICGVFNSKENAEMFINAKTYHSGTKHLYEINEFEIINYR